MSDFAQFSYYRTYFAALPLAGPLVRLRLTETPSASAVTACVPCELLHPVRDCG